MSTLHDTDFYSWTQQQSALLRTASFSALDITNLIDEIEDMGRSEKRELKSCLRVLLMHLLKWKFQPRLQGRSWRATIVEQRSTIMEVLEDNPSLKPIIQDTMDQAYSRARKDACIETRINLLVFPTDCPWSFEQVIDDDFWPQ